MGFYQYTSSICLPSRKWGKGAKFYFCCKSAEQMLLSLLGRRGNQGGDVIIWRGYQLLMGKALWSVLATSVVLTWPLYCSWETPELLWEGVILFGFTKQGCCTLQSPKRKVWVYQRNIVFSDCTVISWFWTDSYIAKRRPLASSHGTYFISLPVFPEVPIFIHSQKDFSFKNERKYWISWFELDIIGCLTPSSYLSWP